MDSGHYICYVRKQTLWYKCDDSILTKVTEEEVLGSLAYMLFYIRRVLVTSNTLYTGEEDLGDYTYYPESPDIDLTNDSDEDQPLRIAPTNNKKN